MASLFGPIRRFFRRGTTPRAGDERGPWRLMIQLDEYDDAHAAWLDYADLQLARAQSRHLRRARDGAKMFIFRNERNETLSVKSSAYRAHAIVRAGAGQVPVVPAPAGSAGTASNSAGSSPAG
jgi:hypothetical protein